ncbi:MAG TPA: hypothetical protein VGN37_27985 [Actinocatenispora sp.]
MIVTSATPSWPAVTVADTPSSSRQSYATTFGVPGANRNTPGTPKPPSGPPCGG